LKSNEKENKTLFATSMQASEVVAIYDELSEYER
jgi:hypothetical protein